MLLPARYDAASDVTRERRYYWHAIIDATLVRCCWRARREPSRLSLPLYADADDVSPPFYAFFFTMMPHRYLLVRPPACRY